MGFKIEQITMLGLEHEQLCFSLDVNPAGRVKQLAHMVQYPLRHCWKQPMTVRLELLRAQSFQPRAEHVLDAQCESF